MKSEQNKSDFLQSLKIKQDITKLIFPYLLWSVLLHNVDKVGFGLLDF